jgi:hypothetical protein
VFCLALAWAWMTGPFLPGGSASAAAAQIAAPAAEGAAVASHPAPESEPALAGATPAAAGGAEVKVLFQGKLRSFEQAIELVPEGCRESLRYWRVWAEEQGFHMAVDGTGRLVVLSASSNKLKAWLATAEKAAKRFDEIAPLPAERLIQRVIPGSGDGGAKLQEPPGGAPAEEGTGTGLPGNIGLPPYEEQPILLFHLTELEQQMTVLQRLAFDHPHLQGWLAEGGTRAGFAVEWPHVGAWLETPQNEEWSPEAELVNRVAQLMAMRRFGHLPFWLRMGLAWKVEWDVIGGIYCFPYRAGFVWATEHNAWPSDLAKMYADRKDYPIQPGELDEWPRETYREEFAKRSFGFVSFLVDNFPDRLTPLLERAREEHERGSLRATAGGGWERVPSFETSAKRLFEHLIELTRPDVAVELTTYLRKGLRYKVK